MPTIMQNRPHAETKNPDEDNEHFLKMGYYMFKEFSFVAFQVLLDTLLRFIVSVIMWSKSDDLVVDSLKNLLEERVCCKCDPDTDFSLSCFLKTCYCRTKENIWMKLRMYLYDICYESLSNAYQKNQRKRGLHSRFE